ncbi:hypothetical protein T439DRAFT_242467 [Meredithblackwellia eburnea MCA 4105]
MEMDVEMEKEDSNAMAAPPTGPAGGHWVGTVADDGTPDTEATQSVEGKPTEQLTPLEREMEKQPWKEQHEMGGRKYWRNSETKETTGEMPQVLRDLIASFEDAPQPPSGGPSFLPSTSSGSPLSPHTGAPATSGGTTLPPTTPTSPPNQ